MGLEAERTDSENSGLNRDGMIAKWEQLNGAWMKEIRGITNGD